ncbi:MAG: PaaI family thioesterase [Nitrospinota bacterium]|nr:MAG: PaaI family thioesterase [Nitrospinota bacterium]
MMYRAPHYGGQPIRRHEKPVLLPPPTPLLPPYPLPEKGKYLQKLQVQEVHRSPGRVRLTMPCTPDHCDEQGRVHEGAIASLMDIAGTVASWTIPQRLNSRGATVGMMLSFCGSAQEEVTADACLQQRSEEMFFNTVQITTTATGRLVAMGNVSYRLLEAR